MLFSLCLFDCVLIALAGLQGRRRPAREWLDVPSWLPAFPFAFARATRGMPERKRGVTRQELRHAMSRPVPLLRQAAVAGTRPGADPLRQHQPRQLSLFADAVDAAVAADASADPGLDLLAEQQRQEDAWHARQDLLRAVQLRLAAQRLWGFPNMVRNPDGPWSDLRGRAYDLTASRQCWPAYYLLRAGDAGAQRITLHVRPGCGGIPVIERATAVLAELAPVSVASCTAPHPLHESS